MLDPSSCDPEMDDKLRRMAIKSEWQHNTDDNDATRPERVLTTALCIYFCVIHIYFSSNLEPGIMLLFSFDKNKSLTEKK